MLLESIKLTNFRQFIDTEIEFSQCENGKNVTMIIGDNGSGKTTIAQAFFWCLYGETDFTDKSVINKKIAEEMRPDDKASVKVELKLTHGDNKYTLIREQEYKKRHTKKPTPQNTKFDIARTDSDGNTTWEKKSQCEGVVESILPKALSKYFFFDGERIEKMSKDISSLKKSNDFANAVKGLLGLDAMDSAIKHFNPNSKYCVIGSYNDSFDVKSNAKMQELTIEIERNTIELNKINARLEEIDGQIEKAQERKKTKEQEIKLYAEGEKLQNKRDKLNRDIRTAENTRSQVYKTICNDFNNNMHAFFSISLIKRALEMLETQDLTDKDIPAINSKTIEYLLKNGFCLCGAALEEGSEEYNNVKEWLNYLPPRSISTSINNFKKDSQQILSGEFDLYNEVLNNVAIASSQGDDIRDYEDELHIIDEKLKGDNVKGKVRDINKEIEFCDRQIRSLRNEQTQKNQQKGRVEGAIDRAEKQRSEIALSDKKNRSIEIYKTYAEKIYDELKTAYEESETRIREDLEKNINDVFKQIYDGGLSLTIDEKYHISIYEDNYCGDIEASTGQNVSAIFAFITAIIKMARENRVSEDENAQMLSSEPYPLVMDAPLSSFDKQRIKSGCEAIPKIADQVVIFIKNTDGDLAEKYMGDKIGYEYTLTKHNELESVLEKAE